MRNTFSARQRIAGPVQRSRGLGRDPFLFYRCNGQRARKRLNHNFQQAAHGTQFVLRQEVKERVCLLALFCRIGCHRFPVPILNQRRP